MNRRNQILSFVLAVQLVIGLVLFIPRGGEESAAAAALLDGYDAASVEEITIQDSEAAQVRLLKAPDNTWVLPDYDNYPVDTARVQTLLDKLAVLKSDRLIAQNSASHNRLKVSEKEFERRVTLKVGDETQVLYIGSSGGANAVHMRAEGSDNVYLTSGLASWEANAGVSSWIDTQYFNAVSSEVVALTLENSNGVFEFRKDGENWTLADLAEGETFNAEAFNTFLQRATSIRMTEPISREVDDAFGMDTPQAVITLTVQPPALPEEEATDEATENAPVEAAEPATYTLTIGAEQDDSSYVMLASSQVYYVKVSAGTATTFTDKTRDNFLVIPEATPTPGN